MKAYSGTQDRRDNPHCQVGRSIARNNEANITAINCIVNFIVIRPVRRWRDVRGVNTWYYEEYLSISRWG